MLECCLQLNGERGAQQSAQAAPGAVPCFLFSCTREGVLARAKFSDCIRVDALNEEHPGRGNSKSKANIFFVTFV